MTEKDIKLIEEYANSPAPNANLQHALRNILSEYKQDQETLIHYKHEAVYYVPCYIEWPKPGKQGHPTFRYSMAEATDDEQMAWSFEPDYVLELRGTFDAKVPLVDNGFVSYNLGKREDNT